MRRLLPLACLLLGLFGCNDGGLTRFDAPPKARITSPEKGERLAEGALVEVRGSASDADDARSDLVVRWYQDDIEVCPGGVVSADGAVRCALLVPAAAFTVELEVRDPEGEVGVARRLLGVIPDSPPTAEITAPSEGAILYSDNLAGLTGRVGDDEDRPSDLVVTWESSLDGPIGASSIVGSDGVVEAWANLSEGDHALVLEVTDTVGGVASDTAIVHVGPPNRVPTCGILTPEDGGSSVEGTTVGFIGHIDDPDEPADRLTLSWSSDLGGVLNQGVPGADGTLLFSTDTLQLGAHIITLTGTDGPGLTCADAITWSVGGPPVIDSVTLAPTPATTDSVVAAVVDVTDTEGDDITLTYAWTINGVSVSETTDSIDGSTAFDKHDVLRVEVTPSDWSATGAPVQSAELVVDNSLPSAPGVTIRPTDAAEGEALTCEVDTASTDADADTVTYTMAWTVDGATYPRSGDAGPSTTSWTDDTTDGTDNLAGEVWSCNATPDDGEDAGTAGTSSLTVQSADTRVFVTSSTFSGGLGGLSSADASCQTAASGAGLSGTWVAYLSGTSRSAKSGIGAGPYVLLDGTLVANDLTDLTDGSIAHAINMDEYGATQSTWVYTGSATDGTAGTNTSTNGLCTDWSTGCGVCYGNHFYGQAGRSYETNSNWSSVGWLFCSEAAALYCFEQ